MSNNWFNTRTRSLVLHHKKWFGVIGNGQAYESLQGLVKFVKDIPPDDEVLVSDLNTRHLLVFDDMMGGNSGEYIVDWFTRKAHHRNTSVVYITQNVFDRSTHHRTISLNTHYMVLFKNPRDKSQVDVLSRQCTLNALWVHFGCAWVCFGCTWVQFGCTWVYFGCSLGAVGFTLVHLGVISVHLGVSSLY